MNLWTVGLLLLFVAAVAAAAEPAGKRPAESSDQAAVARGNNQFAFDLYARLREREGNLFFSPTSLSTALAMTYAGARGQTAEQMARTLHFPFEADRLHAAYGELLRDWNERDRPRPYQLRVANALWGQKGSDFQTAFLELTRRHYGAGLREVDFAANPEAARQTINAWVEEQTNDKIEELIKPGVLDAQTELVLTNAIYFKGDWARPFPKQRTRDGDFFVRKGEKVTVPLMSQKGSFPYFEGRTFQALALPYAGNELSMVVLLPKEVDGLAALEKGLTAEKLAGWLPKLREQELTVILPRFKTTAEFQLAETLAALGMPAAFSGRADFSGISARRDALAISDVVHKAFVEVNEEGTEAAAATGVLITRAALGMPPTFRADHPFVFLIRDNRSGSVLFLGRVVNPK